MSWGDGQAELKRGDQELEQVEEGSAAGKQEAASSWFPS